MTKHSEIRSPIVSIVSPCLNGNSHLVTCVDSLMAQSFQDWELVFIDDGSTDGSLEYMTEVAGRDPRIIVLQTSGRLGAASARNIGIEAARGRYIAFLDCDDWWHPEKLSRQINLMRQTGAAFSCTAYTVCNSTGNPLRLQLINLPLTRNRYLLKRSVIGCLTVMLDKVLLGDVKFPPQIRVAEDFALWCILLERLEAHGLTACTVEEPLAFYRVHDGGQSRNKLKHAVAHWLIYRDFLHLPWHIALWCLSSYSVNAVFDRVVFSFRRKSIKCH